MELSDLRKTGNVGEVDAEDNDNGHAEELPKEVFEEVYEGKELLINV